jgi:glycosidase
MKLKFYFIGFLFFAISFSYHTCSGRNQFSQNDTLVNHKLVIYQMLPRLFGNKNTTNMVYGSLAKNGSGKFEDINQKALQEIKKLGVNYIWYTGIIAHATMTDYSTFGIKNNDPDVVKGIAGSPYAIKDYYDVDPDLAVNVSNRMAEFESLVKRTHDNGLKLIIDFIPNHVSRVYHSDKKPAGVKDFGEEDDHTIAFSPKNDFYYIPGKHFQVPSGYIAGGIGYKSPLKDGAFDEYPAKATGNNVFTENPALDDWFETVKLNYGMDVQNNQNHYDSIPPVWFKARDILKFWANKGVDGFRCDVAEMVPVDFWAWVIPEIKKINPAIIFIGEAYDSTQYEKYINKGKFDYLYDKVGLYDGLKRLIKNEANADVKDIHFVTHQESVNIPNRMLRFLENHDEERIASKGFANDPKLALPAMAITATLSGGPVMIYSGQEVGEPASGSEGFGGDDNKTTIFDYWGIPNHQKWMNKGAFDGGKLSSKEKSLRNYYQKLLNFSVNSEAIKFGKYFELNEINNQQTLFGKKVHAFVRSSKNQSVLVIANFDRSNIFNQEIQLPQEIIDKLNNGNAANLKAVNIITNELFNLKDFKSGILVDIKPTEALILVF